MSENWMVIEEFPMYQVSDIGRIANRETGRELRLSQTRIGSVKVGLVGQDGVYTRGVALLVATAFIEGRDELFNTPVHLDGDPTNNAAYNLVWRPRWFAWKYARQFHEGVAEQNLPVRDKDSRQKYSTMMEAAVANGLLVYDIWKSVRTGKAVFPTGQIFVLAK